MCYACVDEILHTILLHCTNIAPSKMMFLHNYCKAHDLIFIFNTSKRFEKKEDHCLKDFSIFRKSVEKMLRVSHTIFPQSIKESHIEASENFFSFIKLKNDYTKTENTETWFFSRKKKSFLKGFVRASHAIFPHVIIGYVKWLHKSIISKKNYKVPDYWINTFRVGMKIQHSAEIVAVIEMYFVHKTTQLEIV